MKGCLTIDIITEMLEEHFAVEKASRLPVIAIYSIYQILLKNIKLYQDKELLPLKGHTASDRYSGFADIEIYTTDKKPFEMVEVKHGIPIDQTMIEDVLNKIKGSPIKRYFILTTAEPNFSGKKKDIFTLVRKIKAVANVDLIPNGIIPSLKYYLRLIPDLKEFIEKYTKNLSDDFKMSSDVKIEHISAWKIIIEKHSVPDIR
jgi:DNA (cytosine-5)-methyltransferase 1